MGAWEDLVGGDKVGRCWRQVVEEGHGKDTRPGLYRIRVDEGISSLPVTNIYGHFDNLIGANYGQIRGEPWAIPGSSRRGDLFAPPCSP